MQLNEKNTGYIKALLSLVFMGVVIGYLSTFWGGHPLPWMLSHVKIFDPNRPLVVGIWFDTRSLGKEFILFMHHVVVLVPCLLIVRKLNYWNTKPVRHFFSTLSIIALSYPATLLFVFTYDVCRYINRMGFTFARTKGLVASGVFFIALILFAIWLLFFTDRNLIFSERTNRNVVRGGTSISIAFAVLTLSYKLFGLIHHKMFWATVYAPFQLICFPALLFVPYTIWLIFQSKIPFWRKSCLTMVNVAGLIGIIYAV